MWRTRNGVRAIGGVERTALLYGLHLIVDHYGGGHAELSPSIKHAGTDKCSDLFGDGCAPPSVAGLSVKEKVVAMGVVVHALLSRRKSAPELTAWSESTVWMLYEALKVAVRQEVDLTEDDYGGECLIRSTVARAYNEAVGDTFTSRRQVARVTDRNMDKWDARIDRLADLILWDRDFVCDEVADLPPDRAVQIKESCDIPPNYYSAVPPVCTERAYRRWFKYLWHTSQPVRQVLEAAAAVWMDEVS